jgi:putative transposase
MPRSARLDAFGTLHHVMARGIERSSIFRSNRDREDFVDRLGGRAGETGTVIYAWALIPNHFHIFLRSGPLGLSHFMRRLLTGYAVSLINGIDVQAIFFRIATLRLSVMRTLTSWSLSATFI